jgi:hypothetical protein
LYRFHRDFLRQYIFQYLLAFLSGASISHPQLERRAFLRKISQCRFGIFLQVFFLPGGGFIIITSRKTRDFFHGESFTAEASADTERFQVNQLVQQINLDTEPPQVYASPQVSMCWVGFFEWTYTSRLLISAPTSRSAPQLSARVRPFQFLITIQDRSKICWYSALCNDLASLGKHQGYSSPCDPPCDREVFLYFCVI